MFIDVGTGMAVHRMSVYYLVLCVCTLSAGAPLLMALIKPDWPYWYVAFPAQVSYLLPMSSHQYLQPVERLILIEIQSDTTSASFTLQSPR